MVCAKGVIRAKSVYLPVLLDWEFGHIFKKTHISSPQCRDSDSIGLRPKHVNSDNSEGHYLRRKYRRIRLYTLQGEHL
jgi:hypothetical protein